jgi:hypothetical protein
VQCVDRQLRLAAKARLFREARAVFGQQGNERGIGVEAFAQQAERLAVLFLHHQLMQELACVLLHDLHVAGLLQQAAIQLVHFGRHRARAHFGAQQRDGLRSCGPSRISGSACRDDGFAADGAHVRGFALQRGRFVSEFVVRLVDQVTHQMERGEQPQKPSTVASQFATDRRHQPCRATHRP